ncbi:PREDICTED: GDSL esterase/lipase 7-like [Nelumbo nucifera]|uniref:GDSL esterase/lipase 7-like n=1 Tax=Nelumbo nucifera TaxID=4432 RepID=A0A1U8ARV2_NELNU|nr:PREDICTED: GDSL esterase/lipase 7-like [Nelumbo nucifera]
MNDIFKEHLCKYILVFFDDILVYSNNLEEHVDHLRTFLKILSFHQLLQLLLERILAPALYVFGDSLLDSGNNNLLPTIAKANYLPYGIDFAGGVTGRFTNGKTISDYIAEQLGLSFSPPSLSLFKSDTITGRNYASGSCGILPESGSLFGKCLNLDDQIDLFQKTIEMELQPHLGSSVELSDHLSKSIFVICIGNNDYISNYLEPNLLNTSKTYTPQAFAQLLGGRFSQGMESLYKLGTRKFLVFEIGTIGCMPIFTRTLQHEGPCVEELNQLVSLFNDGLPAMLKQLTTSLQGSTFAVGHGSKLGYDMITNPSKYGLTDATDPCCIAGNGGTLSCIPGSISCFDVDKHAFWFNHRDPLL